MTQITFLDIETEIKKIPVDKLPIVYNLILNFSKPATYSLHHDSDDTIEGNRIKISKIQDLCGIIKLEDMKDYEEIKTISQTGTTNYADTVDEVVYGIKKKGRTKDE